MSQLRSGSHEQSKASQSFKQFKKITSSYICSFATQRVGQNAKSVVSFFIPMALLNKRARTKSAGEVSADMPFYFVVGGAVASDDENHYY